MHINVWKHTALTARSVVSPGKTVPVRRMDTEQESGVGFLRENGKIQSLWQLSEVNAIQAVMHGEWKSSNKAILQEDFAGMLQRTVQRKFINMSDKT